MRDSILKGYRVLLFVAFSAVCLGVSAEEIPEELRERADALRRRNAGRSGGLQQERTRLSSPAPLAPGQNPVPGPFEVVPLPQGARLIVHEWGAIRIDLATGRSVTLAEDLPDWIPSGVRRVPSPSLDAIPALKPVLYFHAEGVERVAVRVRVPAGKPTVWWPQAQAAAEGADGCLTWPEVFLTDGSDVRHTPRPAPIGHWIARARSSGAAWCRVGQELEHYLFYEADQPNPNVLDFSGTAESMTITNRGAEPIHDLIVIRREGEALRWRFIDRLETGASAPVGFDGDLRDANLAETPEAFLRRRLVEGGGLFRDEADGMVDIWKEDFFAPEGISVLYRWDPATYDRILPLSVSPRPDHVRRAMMIQLTNIDPSIGERVGMLLTRLGDSEWKVREEAAQGIVALGAPARPYVERALQDPDLEVRSRAREILDRIGTVGDEAQFGIRGGIDR